MHKLKLQVHPYVIQDDNLQYSDNAITENHAYIQKGVDGLFTEFPHTTYETFTKFLREGKEEVVSAEAE